METLWRKSETKSISSPFKDLSWCGIWYFNLYIFHFSSFTIVLLLYLSTFETISCQFLCVRVCQVFSYKCLLKCVWLKAFFTNKSMLNVWRTNNCCTRWLFPVCLIYTVCDFWYVIWYNPNLFVSLFIIFIWEGNKKTREKYYFPTTFILPVKPSQTTCAASNTNNIHLITFFIKRANNIFYTNIMWEKKFFSLVTLLLHVGR